MTAPRAREQADPPSPPDRRPPRRGAGSSPSIYAASAAGRRVPPVARHGLVRSARALAAAALLALTGALFLPATAEAQTATTLVSNTGQLTDVLDNKRAVSQRFTTGSNEEGYTLTGVDVVSASSTGFTAQVCGVDSDTLKPTSTCTDLTAPGTFAVGTMSFIAPTDTPLLTKSTTYAVVVTAHATNTADAAAGETYTGVAQGWGLAGTNGEDADPAAGWSLSDTGHAVRQNGTIGSWKLESRELRIAIKGSAGGGTPLPSTDATLSALSLGTDLRGDKRPGGVVFDQPFASGTTAYTATVGNAENDVQVLATASDADATIEYLDASDTALSDPNDVDLSVGSNNVIKVKVTAEDDTTTQTYTVTVTRVADVALTPPSDALVSTLGRGTATQRFAAMVGRR